MVSFDLVSDLHLDFWVSPKTSKQKQRRLMHGLIKEQLRPSSPANTLIIAGDIGHYNAQNILFLELLAEYYEHVFLTWGNHDLYLVSNSIRNRYGTSDKRLQEFKEACTKIEHVTFLDGDIVEYNSLRIWGSGLWYPVAEYHINHWRYASNDASLIVRDDGYRQITYDEYGSKKLYRFDPQKLYHKELQKLSALSSDDDIDIIITHIPPMLPSWLKDRDDFRFYRFDGIEYIRRIKPKIWCFGHVHRSLKFEAEGVKLLCNALGYPDEYCKRQNRERMKSIEL
jgi:Icc-related predicted phosphoesterase